MEQKYAFIMEVPEGRSLDRMKLQESTLIDQGWKPIKSFNQKSTDGKVFHCIIFKWPEQKEEETSEWESH